MRGVAQVVKCLICQHPEFKSQSHQKKENTPTHIHMYIYIYTYILIWKSRAWQLTGHLFGGGSTRI
jgi:hypothetical protein